jgi:hypothetical protein
VNRRSETVDDDREGVVMTRLWCWDCADDEDFDAVPDAHESERACTECAAGVLVGYLVLPEPAEFAAVA